MLIREAVPLGAKEIITFVGGGGKTTAMFRLAHELKDVGKKVVVTTTTRIFLPQQGQVDKTILSFGDKELYQEIKKQLDHYNLLAVGGGVDAQGKMLAVSTGFIEEIIDLPLDCILVEGDGAAGKPFKAPAYYEPVIPEISTMVIPVVGIDSLGKPLNDKYIHRSYLVSQLTGLPLGEIVDTDTVIKVFAHPNGYMKRVPVNARWVPIINKVENEENMDRAYYLAEKLLKKGAQQVLIGALESNDPIRKVLGEGKH